MHKPKVFVTRLIPAAGLEQVREYCDADIWTEPLPPPADVLRRKVSDCEGLLSLLTERIDGALLDAAPRLRVVSNYAVGFNNIDIPAATERRYCRGEYSGCADRRDGRHGLRPVDFGRPPHRRVGEVRRGRAVEDLGADGAYRTGHGRPHAGHRRHGPHRLCDGPPVSRRLGHAG